MTVITIEALCLRITSLDAAELESWIAQDLVRPTRQGDAWQFREIDVARVQLIHELHHDFRMSREALPVVLSLLDQLHDTRRQLRRLRDAVLRTAPPEVNRVVIEELRSRD